MRVRLLGRMWGGGWQEVVGGVGEQHRLGGCDHPESHPCVPPVRVPQLKYVTSTHHSSDSCHHVTSHM